MSPGLVAARPRELCLVQAFRFDEISGGLRLSMMPGPYPSKISPAELLGAAYAAATARGGRLEVAAIAPWRYLVRKMLGRLTETRKLIGGPDGVDVYQTAARAPRRKETSWRARARKEILAAASLT